MEDPAGPVWSPGLGAGSLSAGGLDVKLGTLFILLLLTLVSGFAPLFLLRRQARADVLGIRHRALRLGSCFAAGVFLATCLLDLMPHYLSNMNGALRAFSIRLLFPLQEFILAVGFFLLLVLEQIALSYRDPPGGSEERALLRGPGLTPAHVDENAHSAGRAVVLAASLSLHAVLEGLAVGLLRESSRVLETCPALLLRKGVLSFSLTLKLRQSHLSARAVLCGLLLYSIMAPLGISIGIVMTEAAEPMYQLACSVLEGIATGTFLYVTFLEVLPHELSSGGQRILKVMAMLCGFSVITAVLFIQV